MRKKTFSLFLVLAGLPLCVASFSQQSSQPAPTTQKLTLSEGTEVPLTFAQNVNSRTARDKEPVEFVLARDLKIGDAIIAEAGSRAIGIVVHSKRPDFWGEPGELNVRMTFLRAGKTKVPIRGAIGDLGTRYVVIRGSQAKILKGTPVTAYADGDTEVEALNTAPSSSSSPAAKPETETPKK